eukprot:TRINITY_DN23680_c0_g1_i1.p1 TRINITY_DN23680_c0_g1~~TRINITY_DN23680_c0_g1_i1.p1  ORF type:complete len:151 (-),score=11.56 TRINITY_DN23680_c0_g1_i1:151-603(-)
MGLTTISQKEFAHDRLVACGTLLFSGALIIYHHAAYPLLLRWYAKSHPARQVEESHRCYKDEQQDCTLPTITILVPAFNEEQRIADKIRNLASLDYPKKKLQVIIACDGCTDNTVVIAQMTIQEAMCSDVILRYMTTRPTEGKLRLSMKK